MSYKLLANGGFSDTTTQAIADVTLAQAITFNTDDIKQNVTHSTSSNSSRITLDIAGTYLITYSAQIDIAASPANKKIEVWLGVDGVFIASTNSSEFIDTINEVIIMTVTYTYAFTAGQYFELYMTGNDTDLQLLAVAAGTTPTRPAIPSIILTVNRIY